MSIIAQGLIFLIELPENRKEIIKKTFFQEKIRKTMVIGDTIPEIRIVQGGLVIKEDISNKIKQ